MSLKQRIKEIASTKNHTFASIEREFGFSQGSIRHWDTSSPASDKLLKVANLLQVSTDWLLTGEESSKALTQNEQEILALLNKLDERNQIKLIGRIEQITKEILAE